MKKTLLPILFLLATIASGCKETMHNPNDPHAYINITIDLLRPEYSNLRFIGNYMYLTSEVESGSRGIIVYHRDQDDFRAYDRIPPNEPNACCDGHGNCKRLVVDFPYVVDSCSMIRYNILNGDIFDGDGVYPLIQYYTSYNYNTNELRIYSAN